MEDTPVKMKSVEHAVPIFPSAFSPPWVKGRSWLLGGRDKNDRSAILLVRKAPDTNSLVVWDWLPFPGDIVAMVPGEGGGLIPGAWGWALSAQGEIHKITPTARKATI